MKAIKAASVFFFFLLCYAHLLCIKYAYRILLIMPVKILKLQRDDTRFIHVVISHLLINLSNKLIHIDFIISEYLIIDFTIYSSYFFFFFYHRFVLLFVPFFELIFFFFYWNVSCANFRTISLHLHVC